MNKKPQTCRKSLILISLPLILGVCAFLAIVGFQALNPRNIAWLNEGDCATYYLGWLFYRNSAWEFPIGLNSSYGLELSSSIVYSDSNPLLAILFKVVSPFLPNVFQYFGIWLLLCFILQAWFSWKLIGLLTDNLALRLLSAGFFVFSPPMLLRVGGHLNLAGHFFIVAALFLVFSNTIKYRKLTWGLLISTAALVHAYLLAMVLAIWIADLVDRLTKKQISAIKLLLEFSVILPILALLCWQAGYFAVREGASLSGFGFFRMNLLSIINSQGWSYVLKALPQFPGDHEGFNYFGIGPLLLLILAGRKAACNNLQLTKLAKQHLCLLILCVVFTLFALSNSIAVGNQFEIKYGLPEMAIKIANVFRASGRFFWPVYYVLLFFVIALIIKTSRTITAVFLLAGTLIIQIVDTSAGWLRIRQRFTTNQSSYWSSPLISPFWTEAAHKYKNVRLIPPENENKNWQVLAYYAAKHGLSTDAVYLARIRSSSMNFRQQHVRELFAEGKLELDTLYILKSGAWGLKFIDSKQHKHLFGKVDGFYVIAPNWKNCTQCRAEIYELNESNFNEQFRVLPKGQRVTFNKLGENPNDWGVGWSTPEESGTWSDGYVSLLYIPIATNTIDSIIIEAKTLVNDLHPFQRIKIAINDIPTQSFIFKETNVGIEIKIPESAKQNSNGSTRLTFHFPDAVRPAEIGLGADSRTLALHLIALTVH